MCRDTRCPAVLTENLFQDNRQDVDFLLSPAGREAIIDLHFRAISAYAGEK
jgi:N-acetylmuramoyl-L-alanine amidase